MSLKSLEDAGWKVFQEGEKWVAERFASRPGASTSIVRVEGQTQGALKAAADLRLLQLEGTEEVIKDTITNDGTLVTGPQHESIRTEGVTVVGAPQVAEAVPNADEAAQAAPEDTTEAVVDAPQAPADAADQARNESDAPAGAGGSEAAGSQSTPSVDASPAAVKLAAEKGVDLASVKGSGKDGKVTKPDVEAALAPATE